MTLYRGPGGTGSASSDADTTIYQDFLIQTQAARDAALAAEVAAELAETNAETAETNAETAATAAASSASASASSASNASTSASNAASSASAASASASNAASSASSASSSASAASTSATSAASSATAAASSASAASTSATSAANSATNASNSASTATTQATNAASSATAAASSATAAQSAQTAAEAARDAALSAYDNFDDRYLGPKASDPTLDNDGNALVTGALYFNTATNVMKVYDGSTWVAAYVSAAGVLLVANNLSDVASTATARANLNVPTRTGGDASGTWSISVTGNAGTVTNGVYTTGDQTINGTKTFSSTISGSINGNAATVTNGVYTTGDQTIGGTKTFSSTIIGSVNGSAATATNATNATNLVSGGTVASNVTGTTQAAKTSDTTLATTAFVDRLRSLLSPSTGSGGGTAVVGDRGSLLSVNGGVTVPANVFAANDTFSIYNNSASNITITQGASLTLRQVGTANTGNRTLAQRGLATVVFISATEAVISGGGLT